MSESAQRAALIAYAAINIALGLIMVIAPGFFFDHIGPYGDRNDHYLGDVAAFYLAAGVGLAVAALAKPAWRAPLCTLGALWYGFHAINHLFDVGEASSDAKGWADTALLALGALAFVLLARAAGNPRPAGKPGDRPPSAIPKRQPDYPPGD